MIHTFAGNPLDRADALRRDPQWLADAISAPGSRFLAFSQLNVLLREGDGTELTWLQGSQIAQLGIDGTPIFLGLEGAIAHFAVDVSAAADPLIALSLAGAEFRDCRMAAMALPQQQAGIVAQARSQLDWHARHQFCSVCGVSFFQ